MTIGKIDGAPGHEHKLPPLRLGPVSKVQGGSERTALNTSLHHTTELWATSPRYPRIVVRDPLGRTLDTFTTLQDAIYRASWTRRKLGEWPKTPLEWRLPKAPVPSRPDYSRPQPYPALSRPLNSYERDHSESYDVTGKINFTADVLMELPTLEIPVDDVAFVAESLNHLPELPSFTFLRHSLLAGQSTYVQIVASLLLHQRQLLARDVRQARWSFPGFCSGCKRAGFCYGCEKNARPHVHEDVAAMTGGGFRFWKRDRPRDPHSWKNPSTWRVPSTEEELRSIIEKYGDMTAYERAKKRAQVESEHPQEQDTKYQRLKNLAPYPPYVTIVTMEGGDTQRRGSTEEDGVSTVDSGLGSEASGRRYRRVTREEEAARRRKEGVTDYQEEEEEEGDRLKVKDFEGHKEFTDISEASTDRILYRTDTSFMDRLKSAGVTGEPVVKMVDEHMEDEQEEVDEGIQSDESFDSQRLEMTPFMGGAETPHTEARDVISQSQGQKQKQTRSPVRDRKVSRLAFTDKVKEAEAEEEARLLRERAKENVPFGKKRNDVTYTAPKFFKVQKQTNNWTVARDPFSNDRELRVPKGGTFQVKKSNKKTTQFIDFHKGDRSWKAPKKFEVKHEEKKTTKFWAGKAGRSQAKAKKSQRETDDENQDKQAKKRSKGHSELSDTDGLLDEVTQGAEGSETTNGDGNLKTGLNETAGVSQQTPQKPKRREVQKKTRVERAPMQTPPQSPSRLPSPPPFKRRSPTPPSPVASPTPLPELEAPPLPELELPEVPDLPEIEINVPENKRKQKLKFMVEPPPPPAQVTETPKKRRAAPKIRHIPKHLSRPRRSKPAEAPVTADDLLDIQDPLDFLAKYCIINPDRLPYYEIVFESTIEDQTPRYPKPAPESSEQKEEQLSPTNEKSLPPEDSAVEKTETKEKKPKKGKSRSKSSSRERQPARLDPRLLPTERGLSLEKVAMSIEEQHLEKLVYTLDLLRDKMNTLCGQLERLEAKRTQLLAEKAKARVPGITSPNFFLKVKKKKGKKKSKQPSALDSDRKLRPEEITDDVIVSRLDGKTLKEMCQEPDVKLLESEIEVCREKFRGVQQRFEQIAAEKLLADAFCVNHYMVRQQVGNTVPQEFRRQQSEMYNRLRPSPDYEMNLEEVEDALQQINNNLLTQKEFYFLFNILNLPRRERINFRLFSIIAALSEKVTQLDPVIRKLINNCNYNALDIKMEKCKELFELLESDHMPKGSAQAASLAVELTAGGMRPEHTRYVMTKFNRDSKGFVDFLDFVTYVPLFVEIHKRIVTDPLSGRFDL